MKTPYEIKKGLYICYVQPGGRTCNECPYFIDDASDCDCAPGKDALAYIQQLEHQIGELTEKVAQLEAAQPKWISVEEQPPVLGCLIYDGVNPPNKCLQLWTIESNGMKVYFDKNPLDLMDALGVHVKDIDGITHIEYWMPMPKVPKHIKKMIKMKRRKKNMTPEPPKEEA